MPKDSTFVEIYGLADLKESLEGKKLKRDIPKGIGSATKTIHSALKFELAQKYNVSHNLDSVLVGKSVSNVTFGKNVMEGGLVYRWKPVDLAKFPYSWEWGNIPPLPKKRKGKVHSVAVRRGSKKVVYGKSNHGGFTQKNGYFGTQMFERVSRERKPLRLLFGPSLSEMASRSLDSPKVTKAIDDLVEYIIEVI